MTEEVWEQSHRPWWRVHQKILFVAVLLSFSAGLFLALRPDAAKDPYTSTAVEISKLIPLVKDLQKAPGASDPAKSTLTYIRKLQLVQKHCRQIQGYHEVITSLRIDSTKQSIINQSRDLCTDLAKLIDYSLEIYTSIEDVMLIRTSPRRYETWEPLRTQIRERHLSATKNALQELQKAPTNDVDFPSSSRSEVKKLQEIIQENKALGYLPSLRQFQMNLLAERQQFWGPYANAEQLTKSLQLQFDAYCQTLVDSKSRPTACKQ